MNIIIKSILSTACLNIALIANSAIIYLNTQTIEVVGDDGTTLMKGAISSGNKNHQTPRGMFRIIQKERNHKSNLYPIKKDGTRGGAEMDYMLKFTHQGNAIHQGYVVFEGDRSIPVSHGCIRLSTYDAREVFNLLEVGDRVKVIGYYDYDSDNFNTKLNKDDIVVIDDGIYDDDIGDTNGLNITFLDDEIE